MNVLEARAILFASIEGGSPFWSREIELLGPIGVVEKARGGDYDIAKCEKTLHKLTISNPSQILEKIAVSGGIFMTREEPFWPEQLDDLVAPPIGLVVRGSREVLTLRSLAIVGTRNPTNYGVRVAGDFAAGFVDREWTIISGGAYGIDAAAHRGALIAEGITVAVLASGIDVNYPAGHMKLFEEITENGLIVSEVMPGVCAVPSRFLTRNRVIAALSRATLVVEAAFRSGSLRTARDAAELFRPVMAIPGPITSPTSEGCHRLIGERAAEVVTSVADAMEFVSSSR